MSEEPRTTPESNAVAAVHLPRIVITDAILSRTAELLASFAERRDSEGVVYWFGIDLGRMPTVTTLVVPRTHVTRGSLATSAEANAEVLLAVVGTPLVYIGQAHSHPGQYVSHSPTDDEETFARFDGAISVVVPYYGRRGAELASCGVHRHIDGAFVRLPADEVAAHLIVVPAGLDFRDGRPSANSIQSWR